MRNSTSSEPATFRWVMCAMCWGQRRIFQREGRHHKLYTCPWCLGMGEDLKQVA